MHTTTLDYSAERVRPREGGFVIDFNTGPVFLPNADVLELSYLRNGERVLIIVTRDAFKRLESARRKAAQNA